MSTEENQFARFSDEELRAELNRREKQKREASRDSKPRKFYRKVEQSFSNERERAKFIAGLAEDVKFETMNGDVYVLDTEAPEELAIRMSRSAVIKYQYDHWRINLYERGVLVGEQGLDGPYDEYAAEWESRPAQGKSCLDPEWDDERARYYLGYSAKPACRYQY